ncbi:MAG: dihydrolipoamide acetyltransferase family protein [Chloroflexota bacterium]
MAHEIVMPEMGEGVTEATVISWLKAEGDTIEVDEPIVEVETDKVTVEITAEVGGVLLAINVRAGTTVGAGTVLCMVGEAGETVETTQSDAVMADTPATVGASTSVSSQEKATGDNGAGTLVESRPGSFARTIDGIRVSPVVARMIQEHDIDVNEVTGTGRDGRVTKRDVLAYLEELETSGEADVPAIATSSFKPQSVPDEKIPAGGASAGATPDVPGELIQLTGMRRAIADHMVWSKRTSPHVTTVFEFDYSAVAAHRSQHKAQFAEEGIRLTYMSYLVEATVQALKCHPLVNASWTDEGIFIKRDIHVGIATAVENGLVVPVIKHADGLNLRGLARQINDLADRARNNRLQPSEVKGGTFSITNHGASGSLIGTPIINQPQVGILGVGMIEKRVKVINDAIAIRPCAYVSFSFDHRILDGATADAFVMDIKQYIEDYPG